MTGRDAEREQLAAALVEGVGAQMPRGHVWNLDKALEPLLPVVDRIANERAAAALEAAADWFRGSATETTLRARAAALRASNGEEP